MVLEFYINVIWSMVSNGPDIRVCIVFTQRENQNRQLRKTKKSRFVFLLWEKKIQNNEIKTPTLEDTIFKKKRRLLKSGNEKMQQTAAQEEPG